MRGTSELPPSADVDVAIVVPVYRNAATLEALAMRVRAAMQVGAETFRLLLVVDASPDESWDVVQRLASSDPRIGGLLLAENAGQHAAILAGLGVVRARWFVVMDADLQDPPEVIPTMLARAREGRGTVFGARQGRYERWDRLATSRVFKTMLSWLSGVPADVGTFFVVDAAVAGAMCGSAVRVPQAVVLAHHCSERWETVPVRRARRPSGHSAYSSRARVGAAIRSVHCALSCRLAPDRSHRHMPPPPVAGRINT
jgi:glycosyltransferase involved in cell wall biosynthesis